MDNSDRAIDTERPLLTANDESAENSKDTVLAKLFHQSGGFGRFQYFIFFTIQSSLSGYCFWFYGLGFLIQEPDYSCTFADPASITDPDAVCTPQNICDDDPRITDSWINYDSPTSLHNWW